MTASEFAWIRSELRALVRTRTIPVRRRERPNPARDTAFFTRGGEPEPVVSRLMAVTSPRASLSGSLMSTGSMTLSPRASMANEDPSLPAHLGRVHEAAEALMNYALERLDANEVRIAPSSRNRTTRDPPRVDPPRLTTPD